MWVCVEKVSYDMPYKDQKRKVNFSYKIANYFEEIEIIASLFRGESL